ncbi:MAG: TRAP transporter small permease subunit [Alphaproteobacteria bacterium]|nr:TRAP transporter small permease subunit [Alphaproteobacteria bacterium]
MATMHDSDQSGSGAWSVNPNAARIFAWAIVALTFAFVINTYLTIWQDFPGGRVGLALIGLGPDASGDQEIPGGTIALGAIQVLIYLLAVIGSVFYVMTRPRGLRDESVRMNGIVTYMIRAAFWGVILVGMADMIISFLRVEDLLDDVFGAQLATDLGRPAFRGGYVHMPLLALSLVVAAVTRTIGFHWLTLMVVVAELLIVLSRFIFSYEQAFQGDLVRFWYAALFLFASAYTLLEDGHVRVDVLYSGFSLRAKGLANAIGCVFLGLSLTLVVMFFGMEDRTSIITSPLINYEVSQSGFGMYVKYLMAGFLAIFAVSMTIQFAATMLDSLADHRGDPGHIDHEGAAT